MLTYDTGWDSGTDWTKIDEILPTLKAGDLLTAPTAYGYYPEKKFRPLEELAVFCAAAGEFDVRELPPEPTEVCELYATLKTQHLLTSSSKLARFLQQRL